MTDLELLQPVPRAWRTIFSLSPNDPWLRGAAWGTRSPDGTWGAFALGLAALVLALEGPIDVLSDYLLSVHMVQHLVLLMVAADVCNVLGITETKQRVLLHRARSRVRRTLEAYFAHQQTGPAA